MDSDYGQAQIQRPAYDHEPQQGIGSGVEEKPKMPVLKKVKEKMKAPVRKLKHSIAKKSKNHGDKPGDDDTASPGSNVASTGSDVAASPDPEEEEEGYEDEEEQQEADHEVHGGDSRIRDALAGARDEDYQAFSKQDEPGNGGLGFGDNQGKLQEDPAAPGSVTGSQHDQQGSFPPTAGGDSWLRDTLAGARDETGKEGLGFGNYQGNMQEDPAAPGSVTGSQHDQQGSFPPTAGEEVDANPSITRSFQDMSVSDQPGKNEKHEQTQQDETLPTSQDVIPPTESHDQFSPVPIQEDEQKPPNFAGIERTGSHNQFSPEPMQEDEQRPVNSASTEHRQERGGDSAAPAGSQEESTYRELPTQEHNPSESLLSENPNNLSYTTKISAAAAGLASTVYEKAATTGTLLKEKVAPSSSPRGQQQSGQQQSGQQLSDQSAGQAQQQPGYTQKVYAAIQPAKERAAALASTVYEKAAGAGAVAKEKAAGAGAVTKDRAGGAGEAAKERAAGARAQAVQTGAGVKNTIAEKLKPGEEEKALSQVIAEMISSRKETAKEKAYEAGDIGAEKAKEQTAVAREKANELKDKTVESKDGGTEKAKEKAAQAREGTDNNPPVVEKIKGAVTSLFGSRASADAQNEDAGERSMEESTEGKQLQHGTNNVGTPAVEKIKGAVTSLFGTRSPADAEVEAAGDRSTQESSEGKL